MGKQNGNLQLYFRQARYKSKRPAQIGTVTCFLPSMWPILMSNPAPWVGVHFFFPRFARIPSCRVRFFCRRASCGAPLTLSFWGETEKSQLKIAGRVGCAHHNPLFNAFQPVTHQHTSKHQPKDSKKHHFLLKNIHSPIPPQQLSFNHPLINHLH